MMALRMTSSFLFSSYLFFIFDCESFSPVSIRITYIFRDKVSSLSCWNLDCNLLSIIHECQKCEVYNIVLKLSVIECYLLYFERWQNLFDCLIKKKYFIKPAGMNMNQFQADESCNFLKNKPTISALFHSFL